MGQPRFANARSVRNELERSRLRHAYRLAADPELSRTEDDLMRLEPADILSSPLFATSSLTPAPEKSLPRLPVRRVRAQSTRTTRNPCHRIRHRGPKHPLYGK
jgi:AAA lid domain